VAQGEGSEFKPQYYKKKKSWSYHNTWPQILLHSINLKKSVFNWHKKES
jgi:hypothetical protein